MYTIWYNTTWCILISSARPRVFRHFLTRWKTHTLTRLSYSSLFHYHWSNNPTHFNRRANSLYYIRFNVKNKCAIYVLKIYNLSSSAFFFNCPNMFVCLYGKSYLRHTKIIFFLYLSFSSLTYFNQIVSTFKSHRMQTNFILIFNCKTFFLLKNILIAPKYTLLNSKQDTCKKW